MRGRTNAQGGGIFLNASTDKYVVANTDIAAGDFVNRYTLIEGGTFLSSDTAISNIFPLTNNRYLLILNNTYYIIVKKNSDGTFTEMTPQYSYGDVFGIGLMQVDSSTFVSVKAIYTYSGRNSAKVFITFTHIDDANGVIQRTITVENLELYVGNTKSSYIVKTYDVNNYCIVFNSYTDDSTDYTSYVSLLRFAITGSAYENYNVEVKYNPNHFNYTVYSKYEPKIKYAEKLGSEDNYIITFANADNIVEYSHYSDLIIGDSIYDVNHSIPYVNGNYQLVKYDDEHIALVYYEYSDRQSIKTNVIYVNGTIDYAAKKVVYSSSTTILDNISNVTTKTCQYFDSVGINDLYLVCGKIMSLLYANTSDYTLAMYPQNPSEGSGYILKKNTEYIRGGGFIKDDVVKLGSIGIIDIDNTNHCMVGTITTTKYVDHIDSTDFVIGVAKQSGSKGDEIDVYVPVVD